MKPATPPLDRATKFWLSALLVAVCGMIGLLTLAFIRTITPEPTATNSESPGATNPAELPQAVPFSSPSLDFKPPGINTGFVLHSQTDATRIWAANVPLAERQKLVHNQASYLRQLSKQYRQAENPAFPTEAQIAEMEKEGRLAW